jgi:hypothetical protein
MMTDDSVYVEYKLSGILSCVWGRVVLCCTVCCTVYVQLFTCSLF